MATAELNLSGSDFCIFCHIASGQDKEADVVKKNEELVCFKDINPAAPHHYLVVPTQHINCCFSLHREHINLDILSVRGDLPSPELKRMVEMGKAVLHDQGITDMADIRMGFHKPPYISVNHLHLHVLAPASQISKYIEYKFIPESCRFVTEESLLKQLDKNEAVIRGCFKSCMCLL